MDTGDAVEGPEDHLGMDDDQRAAFQVCTRGGWKDTSEHYSPSWRCSVLDEMPDVPDLLAALEAAGVRFVLIGGLAMAAHGSAHITQDIDICYARDAGNVTALVAAPAPHRPRLRSAPDDLPFVLEARTFKNI